LRRTLSERAHEPPAVEPNRPSDGEAVAVREHLSPIDAVLSRFQPGGRGARHAPTSSPRSHQPTVTASSTKGPPTNSPAQSSSTRSEPTTPSAPPTPTP